jgi:hypothetical protein
MDTCGLCCEGRARSVRRESDSPAPAFNTSRSAYEIGLKIYIEGCAVDQSPRQSSSMNAIEGLLCVLTMRLARCKNGASPETRGPAWHAALRPILPPVRMTKPGRASRTGWIRPDRSRAQQLIDLGWLDPDVERPTHVAALLRRPARKPCNHDDVRCLTTVMTVGSSATATVTPPLTSSDSPGATIRSRKSPS